MAKFPDVRILPDDDPHWDLSRTGDIEARNYIVEYHMQLVIQIVHSLMRKLPQSIEKDDLVGYGCFGLIKAAETYDPSRSKFITHAAFRINNAIYDGLRKEDWAPKSLRRNLKDIERARVELFNAWNREPTDEEIAEFIGKDEAWVTRLRKIEDSAKPVILSSVDTQESHISELERLMSHDDTHTTEEQGMANALQQNFVDWLSSIDDDLKVLWVVLNYLKIPPHKCRVYLDLSAQEYANLRKRLSVSFEEFLDNLRARELDSPQEV